MQSAEIAEFRLWKSQRPIIQSTAHSVAYTALLDIQRMWESQGSAIHYEPAFARRLSAEVDLDELGRLLARMYREWVILESLRPNGPEEFFTRKSLEAKCDISDAQTMRRWLMECNLPVPEGPGRSAIRYTRAQALKLLRHVSENSTNDAHRAAASQSLRSLNSD